MLTVQYIIGVFLSKFIQFAGSGSTLFLVSGKLKVNE